MHRFVIHSMLALILGLIALVPAAPPVLASARDQPPPLPGWTRAQRYQDDTAQQHGVVVSGGRFERASPVIADIDNNLGNGREVVIGGIDGRIYAYRANGQLLWQVNAPIAGCANVPLIVGRASVGDLFGDGTSTVLIGYGPIEATGRACDGGVLALRGTDGGERWRFSLKNFEAQTPEPPEAILGVISGIALADTDGDRRLEVAFGGLDRNVYLLNADGSVRWYYHAADTVWSTPLFMNVDGDPQLELVVGTDISANAVIVPPTQDGGYMHAFDTQPRNPNRINFQTGFLWRTPFDQVIYSSPLAADVLPNNPGLEIVFGSGCFFPENSADKRGRWLKIVRPSDGAVLQTLNAPACVQSSPAAGDIDGDGQLELVATVSGAQQVGGDGRSRIVAWDPTNPSPKWATATGDPNSGSNDPFGGDLQSPVIADVDGNGSLEVLAANFWSVHVLNGATGAPLSCQNEQCGNQGSLFAWFTLKSTPAIGDINNDGVLDVVIGGSNVFNSSRGHLYAWTNIGSAIRSPAGNLPAYAAPWPQFRRDALANGVLAQAAIVASTTSLGAVLGNSATRSVGITVRSGDGGALSWTAAEANDSSNIVRLENTSGTAGEQLLVTLDGRGKASGLYEAVIELRAQGLPSVQIPVRVRVVEQERNAFLPLTRR